MTQHYSVFGLYKVKSLYLKGVKRLKEDFVLWLSTCWGYINAFRLFDFSKGRIVEAGSHLSLLAKEKGFYKHLWDLQIRES